MDLNPTEEQQLLMGTFGAFCAKESSSEGVRSAEPLGQDPDLWRKLQDMGALEMAVGKASGGSAVSRWIWPGPPRPRRDPKPR
jgi:alkylation response protein AidB-like acyl-CoA dehydrogenase